MRKRPVAERFREKVNRDGPVLKPELGPCWIWTAGTNGQGYGQFAMSSSVGRHAHRVAWMLEHGEFPALDVLHRCDNPPCVRPSHLFLGDDDTNAKDRKAKGRNGDHKGTANGRAILAPEQVLEIRRLYAERTLGPKALAANYGVSVPTIWYVLKRGWTHL